MAEFDYWKLLAGVGIFLFGMQLLETAVKDLSGKAFRRIIRDYTNTRIKAIANGVLVTAILQSSSAVSLMVLAFVGAGIMQMENAVGVILGSNIGTTLTAWIVATVGFKMKIETFALPFIGISAAGLILFRPGTRAAHLTRLLIGFGFLFLGLDYMKTSVEHFAKDFDPRQLQDLALWTYLLIGILLTAVMQASAATFAITLAALSSGLMTFEMGAAMVIGANIGTTITILLGAMGGSPPKKRVAASHLAFNLVTGVVAFAGLSLIIRVVEMFVDISTNGPVGLALFHTFFNVTGVVIFLPFIPVMTRLLVRFLPEQKQSLSVFLDVTPVEEIDAASIALKNEIIHLLQECQLYTLRCLGLDEKLVFDDRLPFEKNRRRKLPHPDLFNRIQQLHSSIIAYYSRIQAHNLEEEKIRELERMILASRNIMNATKNFESIRPGIDDLESSDAGFPNRQASRFRKRLLSLLTETGPAFSPADPGGLYQTITHAFEKIETEDNRFIKETVKASSAGEIGEKDLSGLFLVNRLFTQACRMMVFSMKDLLLTPEQILSFNRKTSS